MTPEDELQMVRNLLVEAVRGADESTPVYEAVEDYFGTLYLIVALEAGCEVADACDFAAHGKGGLRDP